MQNPRLALLVLGIAIGTFSLGQVSFAEKNGKPAKTKATKKKSQKTELPKGDQLKTELPKTKTFIFGEDEVDGDRVMPDTETIYGIMNVKHGNLISLRTHFLNEIVFSTNAL
jgi:hypothetical protein